MDSQHRQALNRQAALTHSLPVLKVEEAILDSVIKVISAEPESHWQIRKKVDLEAHLLNLGVPITFIHRLVDYYLEWSLYALNRSGKVWVTEDPETSTLLFYMPEAELTA